MIQSLIGKKIDQTQGFLQDGTRVPLSVISVADNVISQIKTMEREGYLALQLGFDITKRVNKPTGGHIKKAGLEEKKPRFFKEVRVDDPQEFTPGSTVPVSEVFKVGDIVDVVGTSKGKGYAGVVKRYRFHGGPKTHGQSDRHRAPGAIGTGTTPGRVLRGKRMSGRMGNERVTVKNLEILDIVGETILVRGLIPGSKGSIVTVKKVGKNKKFMPLWSENGGQKTEESGISENSETQNVGEIASQASPDRNDIVHENQNIESSTQISTLEKTVKTPEAEIETPEEKVEKAENSVQTAGSENSESQTVSESENQNSSKEVNKDGGK